MPLPLKPVSQLAVRFAPLLLFVSFLFLLFAIYLSVQSTSSRLTLQNLQTQQHLLLDQKRILEGQVSQLQADHSQKEALVRVAEKELSLGEQQKLAANLQSVQQQEKQARQKALAAGLEMGFRKTAGEKEVEVLIDEKNLTLRFYESTLFDPGEIAVNSSGRKLLALVAQSLNHDFTRGAIRIQGNSDNAPVNGGLKARFPSNWELTAYRAATVARSLQENGQVDSARLTPVGQAGNDPIASNDSREGRAKNRRIDLVIPLQESPSSSEAATTPASTP